MTSTSSTGRRRVLIPQALGSEEFLRVTWHESRQMMVFSQWDGPTCVAAIPVRVDDLDEVAALAFEALGRGAMGERLTWPAPRPSDLVVPAAGLLVSPLPRSA